MIITAALKLKNKNLVFPCLRHNNGLNTLRLLGIKDINYEVGFIKKDQGGFKFVDPEDAYEEARHCGQLSDTIIAHKTKHKEHTLLDTDIY